MGAKSHKPRRLYKTHFCCSLNHSLPTQKYSPKEQHVEVRGHLSAFSFLLPPWGPRISTKSSGQWFSTFLMLWHFKIFPHIVVTQPKIILLLFYNCNYATVMNHIVNICCPEYLSDMQLPNGLQPYKLRTTVLGWAILPSMKKWAFHRRLPFSSILTLLKEQRIILKFFVEIHPINST